jgi:hypothetical protein
MNRKDLKETIKVLNQQQQDKPKRGRPITQFKEISKTSQQGTKENETRATFIVNEALLAKVKAIAYWDRIDIKDVVDAALKETVSKYEKGNGAIKPVPVKTGS